MNNLIPKQVDIAFDNVNEIMEAMTTQGQKDLDIYYNKEKKFFITNYGIVLDMKNSEGKGFSVLVMDHNDPDILRKRILNGAKAISENFPHLVSDN